MSEREEEIRGGVLDSDGARLFRYSHGKHIYSTPSRRATQSYLPSTDII